MNPRSAAPITSSVSNDELQYSAVDEKRMNTDCGWMLHLQERPVFTEAYRLFVEIVVGGEGSGQLTSASDDANLLFSQSWERGNTSEGN